MTPHSKALALSYFTVLYNILEGAVAIFGASTSGSSALFGFGLDSFIESLSGMVMIWRFWKFAPDEEKEEFERVEHRAERLVAYSFFILGAYIIFDAGSALYWQKAPGPSLIGIGLAIASTIIMPVLFLLKYRLGKSIGSRSLVADSKETLACVLLSVALLLGLGTHYLWGLWWVDSITALVIAYLIVREGIEILKEGASECEQENNSPFD
ncbi:MAG: cation transporter [Planctomycetaceae bacterium]|nr:cation transporter [Planctomycetaceae bacterium]